jgi:hypothetical protein
MNEVIPIHIVKKIDRLTTDDLIRKSSFTPFIKDFAKASYSTKRHTQIILHFRHLLPAEKIRDRRLD